MTEFLIDRPLFPRRKTNPYRAGTQSARTWALLVANPGKTPRDLIRLGARARTFYGVQGMLAMGYAKAAR